MPRELFAWDASRHPHPEAGAQRGAVKMQVLALRRRGRAVLPGTQNQLEGPWAGANSAWGPETESLSVRTQTQGLKVWEFLGSQTL